MISGNGEAGGWVACQEGLRGRLSKGGYGSGACGLRWLSP